MISWQAGSLLLRFSNPSIVFLPTRRPPGFSPIPEFGPCSREAADRFADTLFDRIRATRRRDRAPNPPNLPRRRTSPAHVFSYPPREGRSTLLDDAPVP